MPVRIGTSDHHPVLFDQTETGGRFTGPGDFAFPAGFRGERRESFRAVARIDVVSVGLYCGERKGRTHMVAIPLHLANMFSPTRSPSNSCLAGPRTMATLVLLS